MQDCNEIVKLIYNHPGINDLINKIHPEHIRDDLRQEIALSLLEQPCERIASLYIEENLIRYAIRTCWLMATSKTSEFYIKYRKNDITKAVDYLRTLQQGCSIPQSNAYIASRVLCDKANESKYSDHETRIFNKFVELGGVRKVARYYGIPAMHVSKVVAKVRSELKTHLCKLN